MPIRKNIPGARKFGNVASFLESGITDSGIYSIRAGGVPIDFEYEDNDSNVTIIIFHAAISSPKTTLPLFAGNGITRSLPINRISVSDPTLTLNQGLGLAWFAGSAKQPGLQANLSKILKHMTARSSRVIYFGASGGGFAALHYSARHEGSIAITVNPQTVIANYNKKAVDRWVVNAWNLEPGKIPPVFTDLTKQYSKKLDNFVFYVQNTGDRSHVNNHMDPFMKAIHVENKCRTVLVDVGQGHLPPTSTFLRDFLNEILVQDDLEKFDFMPLVSLENARH